MFSTVKRAPRREKRKQNGTSGELATNMKTFCRATFQKGAQIPPGKCTKSCICGKVQAPKKTTQKHKRHIMQKFVSVFLCFPVLAWPGKCYIHKLG